MVKVKNSYLCKLETYKNKGDKGTERKNIRINTFLLDDI